VDLSPFFTPLKIGSVTLPNRFVMPAMQRGFAGAGVPTADMARYYRRRIEGGVALVIGEGTAVNHPSSTDYLEFALLTPAALEGWKRVVDEVKQADGHIFMQLWHQGAVREEGEGHHPDAPTLSPSGLRLPGVTSGREMTLRDLIEVREAYVEGAQIAQEVGFDGVEIHSAHGYLLDQFLWPEVNLRDDEYGGSLEGRARYPCEVVRAVRAAVGPQFPISVRLSQWKTRMVEAINFANPAELQTVLELFVAAGADIFHASTRRFWLPEFPGSDLGLAGWTKHFTGKPVITVGSVGLEADIMTSLEGADTQSSAEAGLVPLLQKFQAGEFDLVAVGRAVLGDADWVSKVRDGRFDALREFSKTNLEFLD
jgi:2,4-dienoyl-CoA reductase-like NADH-dependent reductase (Old Yellow Enzyme family)